MSIAEALLLALVLAILFTLISGAGWWIARRYPSESERYVTVARWEAALAQQQERHDAAMAAMERRLQASVARQDGLERQLDEEREKRRSEHALLAELQRLVEAWMRYARQLADIIRRELKIEPPPEPDAPAAPLATPKGTELLTLSRRIARLFSMSEIDALAEALELGDVLSGETLEQRASSLVRVALQRERLSSLVKLCQDERPNGGF